MAISSQQVVYFQPDGVPGQYFECARYGTMSVTACARNFTEAPLSVRQGRLQHCIGCKLGSFHAGVHDAPVPMPAPTAFVYRAACVRCRRDGRTAGSRLIGRLRLVRDHTICVSCYNREREVLIGANAKGARPKKWSGLFRCRAAYLSGSRAIVMAHPDPVLDRIELALTMLRLGRQHGVVWARPAVISFEPIGG
jgi:hypothetical protein